MKTSRKVSEFLQANCEGTNRNIFQKKGIGIYKRKVHWAGPKEAPALHQLAGIQTVDGSDCWHMIYDIGHVRHILVREGCMLQLRRMPADKVALLQETEDV